MSDSQQYLTPPEVSERYGGHLSVNTLTKWRNDGQRQGPPFLKLGSKIVYPLDALVEWEKSRLFRAVQDYTAVK